LLSIPCCCCCCCCSLLACRYGEEGFGDIPGGQILVFRITLVN
jgi:hypothetical protein